MPKELTVADMTPGDIFETIGSHVSGPLPTGDIYKRLQGFGTTGKPLCRARFNSWAVGLAPETKVRKIDPATIDGGF